MVYKGEWRCDERCGHGTSFWVAEIIWNMKESGLTDYGMGTAPVEDSGDGCFGTLVWDIGRR